MTATSSAIESGLTPVMDSSESRPEAGMGLCLSGGGFRAMLFHLGTLMRLNQAGYLPLLRRVSGVSGGAVVAALLGMKWSRLDFSGGVAARLIPEVVDPIRAFTGHTIDVPSALSGILLPGSINDKLVSAYGEHLFGGATLQDLPDDPPRFVLNATNVQSGVLVRFSKPYMRDYKVGEVRDPRLPLALVAAASSAFPPVFSPASIPFEAERFTEGDDATLTSEQYRRRMMLTDGGVYDNLGLEPVWKRLDTVLVSDAGMRLAPDPQPGTDWLRHTRRILEIIDSQVRSLRKRQLIGSFEAGLRKGCYWGIGTLIADYGLEDALPCPPERSLQLAAEPTRLARLPHEKQERLINWGYAVCDAALRRYLDPSLAAPAAFPYPGGV